MGTEPSGSGQTVAVLSFTPTANDPRVLRQVEALAGDYRIITCGYGEPIGPDVPHLRIPDGVNWLPMNFTGLTALAVRAHRRAYSAIPAVRVAADLLADSDFDLLLTNDVETVPLAIATASGRPVVVDLHEFGPGQSGDWRWKLAWRPLLRRICEEQLPRVTSAVAVAPGIADKYKGEYGVDARIVTNAGPYRAPEPSPVTQPLRLVHHGAAIPGREIERMIFGVAELPEITLDLYLVKMVRYPKYFERLADLARNTDNVNFRATVPMHELPETLDQYDAGIFVLPPTGFNYLHALPNKFFDYVQSGLPVIIGPSPEMASIAREYGLGLVLPDWEVETLRNALPGITTTQVEDWQKNVCAAAEGLSSQRSAEVICDVVASALASPTD